MSIECLKTCVKVAACICGKDGIISEMEEQTMFQMLDEKFPEFDKEIFEAALTEFFDSDNQIEDYLALLDDEDTRLFTLKLAEVSAAADSLVATENIALEKSYLIWGIKRDA
jgi:hypothetical protein